MQECFDGENILIGNINLLTVTSPSSKVELGILNK
jgi:hypothetical protein